MKLGETEREIAARNLSRPIHHQRNAGGLDFRMIVVISQR
jgi:hypothetical protein